MAKRHLKRLIWIGLLWINFPILLISIGLPLLILRYEPVSPFYLSLLLAGLAFVLALGLSWFYWSLMIPKWRIWAFSKVPESEYPTLKKLAITTHLIWADRYPRFTKTEIRSQQAKAQIEDIEEETQAQREIEHLKTLLNTGNQVIYPLSRAQILISFAGNFIFFISCIYLCFTPYYPLGILAVMVWAIDYKNLLFIFHLNERSARLEINQQGIFSSPVLNRMILWESINYYYLDRNSQLLFLVIEENGKEKKLKIRLWPYQIQDYDLLEEQIGIFVERFLQRWEQRSVEDN